MAEHHEMPPDTHQKLVKAARLEWLSILYLLSAIVLLYFTLGSSQAMKAAWVEDILGLTPPIAFLIASRVRNRKPNDRFPYGYHRATAIAYLCASVALLALGGFILYDSVSKLLKFEHPPIDLVKPCGDQPIWLGWLMLAALAYSAVPQVILGKLKQPLAKELNDKVLFADAEMNRADWMTGAAAMAGVVGIGAVATGPPTHTPRPCGSAGGATTGAGVWELNCTPHARHVRVVFGGRPSGSSP